MFTFLAEITQHKQALPKTGQAAASPRRAGESLGVPEDLDLFDLRKGGVELGNVKLGDARLKDIDPARLKQLRLGDHRLRHLGGIAKKLNKTVGAITIGDIEAAEPVWEYRHSLQDLRKAVEKTIQQIIVFQLEAAQEENGGLPIEMQKLLASNINISLSDGYQLLAIRCRNSVREHPPSLYFSRTAGPYLNRAFVGNPDDLTPFNPYVLNFEEILPADKYKKHFIICSEPTTVFKEGDPSSKLWELVPKNRGVLVDENLNEEWFDVDMGL